MQYHCRGRQVHAADGEEGVWYAVTRNNELQCHCRGRQVYAADGKEIVTYAVTRNRLEKEFSTFRVRRQVEIIIGWLYGLENELDSPWAWCSERF